MSPAFAGSACGGRTIRPPARAIAFTSDEFLLPDRRRNEAAVGPQDDGRAHIVLTGAVGADVGAQNRDAARIRAGLRLAMQRAKQGAEEQDRADHRGGRVAGQAEHDHAAELPMHQRLPRAHRDAPEAKLHAEPHQRLLDEIVVADRGAAERDEHVRVAVLGARDRRFDIGGRIARNAEVERNAARGGDEPGDREIVRRHDLRRPGRFAGRHELVAGRENRDPRPTAHRQRRMIGGGRERDVARAQPLAGAKQRLSFEEVEPRIAKIVAGSRRRPEKNAVAVALHVLLDDDRVGALRHRGAGENPHRLSGPDDARKGAARRGFADEGQRRGRVPRILGPQRITVHRRIGEGRLGPQRRDRAGEHTPVRGVERHDLFGERRGHGGKHAVQRLADGNHAAHDRASAARQSPDLPPRFSRSRMPSIVMPRSIAFAMS